MNALDQQRRGVLREEGRGDSQSRANVHVDQRDDTQADAGAGADATRHCKPRHHRHRHSANGAGGEGVESRTKRHHGERLGGEAGEQGDKSQPLLSETYGVQQYGKDGQRDTHRMMGSRDPRHQLADATNST